MSTAHPQSVYKCPSFGLARDGPMGRGRERYGALGTLSGGAALRLDMSEDLWYSKREYPRFYRVGGETVKAMILAAGLGTRLLPLTREIAKPAIPFANRPLIHHCLEWLEENGVEEVVINLHYHPQSVVAAIMQGSWPLKINFSHEPILLGTAGGLKKAEGHFQDSTFAMVNSDSLSEIDLAAPTAYHREKGAMATMVLKEKPSEDPYGTVRIDGEGRVRDIKGRGVPQGEGRGYTFTGIHLFEPEIFRWVPSGRLFEINRMVYPRLIQEGRGVWGYVTDAFWAEVGSHETYLQAHRDFLVRRSFGVVSETHLSSRIELVPPVLIGRGCHIGDGARIGPLAIVGHNCDMGQRAVVEDSVLWNEVTLGPGARVRGSIVGHGATIPPGTQLRGMAIWGGEQKRIDSGEDKR